MQGSPAINRSTNSVLRDNASAWLSVVARRRSRRTFDGAPVSNPQLQTLRALAASWRPYDDVRTVIVTNPTVDVFTGVIGGYGKVHNAPHAMLFIAEKGRFADQHAGYTGEGMVLAATHMELDTCWIGGSFDGRKVARLVELSPSERVVAVSPLGHALGTGDAMTLAINDQIVAHSRKPVADLAPDSVRGGWPAWALAAVETARMAPSASNRQPWRFRFEDGGLVVSKDSAIEVAPKVAKRIDIGIAMLHVALAVAAHGIEGTWTDLVGRDVARFDPLPTTR